MNEPRSETARSHEFHFTAPGAAALGVPTLIAFVVLVAGLHLLHELGWLPAPAPVLTGDEFVMRNRHEAALSNDPAELLIIGDSSAAMGVDAQALSVHLPGHPPAYNLGLFLGLPMEVYAEAAQKFIEHHPGQVRAVVLLTTFSRLADARPSEPSLEHWRRIWSGGAGGAETETFSEGWLSSGRLHDDVVARLLPFGMHGERGVFYGSIVHARQFASARRGAMQAREVYNRQTSAEKIRWVMDPAALDQARRARGILSSKVMLIYGIMPLPETYATSDSKLRRAEMMRALNAELGADHLLDKLPVTFPDGLFSDLVHLNLDGQRVFTRRLAAELAGLSIGRTNAGGPRPATQ